MRAERVDAPEEAGEERRDADPPLLEGERDVGMRGMLTGMLSKLLSQVGAGTQADVANVAAVEEMAAVSDEEWEAADFQDADLEERVAVEIIERAWKGYRMRRFLRSRVRWIPLSDGIFPFGLLIAHERSTSSRFAVSESCSRFRSLGSV